MVPVGLLALERDAIFTAPDVKSAISNMIFLESDIFFENNSRINLGGFFRLSNSKSFNGDSSELSLCNFSGDEEVLIEGLKPNLFDLGLSLDEVCGPANIFGARDPDELETALETSVGLEFDLDEIDDIYLELDYYQIKLSIINLIRSRILMDLDFIGLTI